MKRRYAMKRGNSSPSDINGLSPNTPEGDIP